MRRARAAVLAFSAAWHAMNVLINILHAPFLRSGVSCAPRPLGRNATLGASHVHEFSGSAYCADKVEVIASVLGRIGVLLLRWLRRQRPCQVTRIRRRRGRLGAEQLVVPRRGERSPGSA